MVLCPPFKWASKGGFNLTTPIKDRDDQERRETIVKIPEFVPQAPRTTNETITNGNAIGYKQNSLSVDPGGSSKKSSYMSIQSEKSSGSNFRDSDSDTNYDRKSSAGRKTISDLVQNDPEKRVRRKRGVIAPHAPLDSARFLTDLQYEKFDKDEKSAEQIKKAVMANDFLRNIMDEERLLAVVEAMNPQEYPAGSLMIREGESGSHLYVSAHGQFEVLKGGQVVKNFGPGEAFGELAILYKAKRFASIRCITEAKVWTLERKVFQKIMVRSGRQEQEDNNRFLSSIPLLQGIHPIELAKIADFLKREFFSAGTPVVRQGDRGDKFYIIRGGTVAVTKREEDGERRVGTLRRGDYFGEQALLHEDRRLATVTALPPGVECLTLERGPFTELLGNLEELKNIRHADPRPSQQKKTSVIKSEFEFIDLKDLEIIGTMGVGGFGRVELVQYRREPSLTFALKCLKKVDMVQQQQQEHAFNEKFIMMACHSRFICRLYRTFKDNKYIYFLMEPVLGGDVWTILQKQRYFPENVARFMAACVVEAFQYLHSKEIIYRDLKPENLMLDKNGYIKLLQFDCNMETVCGSADPICRVQALAALLHSFNLYCAVISAALICCCASKHRGKTHRWRGQNIRGMATLVVGVAWVCGAAGGCLRPTDTVQLVAALVTPLSWLAAAVLHVAIWTRHLTAPILYLGIYWLLASTSSGAIVYYYAMESAMVLDVFVHGVAATLALLVSVVDFICFYDEIRKRTFLKSSPESKNESYRYNDTHFYSKITFFWLNSLLYRGYETPLEKADLGSIPENEKSKKFYNKFKCIFNSQKVNKDDNKHVMWRCFARIVWPNFYVAGILKLFGDIAGIIPAVGLGAIIHYIEDGNATDDANGHVTITEFLSNGYVVLLIITLSLILQALLSQNATHLVTVEGTRLKIAIQNMVYDKCMKLAAWSPDGEPGEESPLLPSKENDASSQSGLLMNLMSQDTYNIMSAVWISHYIWATPLKVTFILYFLYRKLGVSALIGTLASLILMMPIQLYIGKRMSDNSKGISKCTDNRISKISEILQGINVIKLYVWEDLFNEKILQLREVELQLLNKESVYSGFLTFTTQISTVLVAVTTFLAHSYVDNTVKLTAVNVFAALALFNHLTISFLILPVTVVMMIQAVVSTKRIRDFLELPEAHNVPEDNVDECKKKDECKEDKFNEAFIDFSPDDNPLSEKYESLLDFQETSSDADDIEFTQGQEYLVRFKNAAFSWRMKENFWVEIDDLDIPAGKLIMVVGSSGSGKTSLLCAILGEMYKERGDVEYNEKCTMWYASQTPWLLERSIKDNILMDSAWCARRYTRVVRATGLRPDLQLLPDGDSTQLGSHGTPLSGGQRVRVCVARTLYSRARLLVLDEPLAALDAPLARQLVARALLPAARSGRTVLLATNRLELLHYADLVIGMEDGRVTGFGKANNLSDGILSEWAKLAAEARSAAARVGAGPPGGAARERSQLLRTMSRIKLEREISEDSIYVPQPMEIHEVAGAYLLSEVPCIGGSWRRPKNVNRGDISRQFSSPAATVQRSKWGRDIRRAVSADASAKPEGGLVQRILHPRSFGTLPRWTQRSLRRLLSSDSNSNENDCGGPVENGIPAEAATFTSITVNGVETTAVPIPGDPSVPQPVLTQPRIWCTYGRVCGWWGPLFVVLTVAARALALASDYWLAQLTSENAQATLSDDKTWNMVWVYACWCAGGASAAAGAGAAGAAAGAFARRALHERLLRATLHAPLHRHALSAAALHRFSADVQVLDRKLPTAIYRWTQLLLLCIAALIINVITTPTSLIALLPAVFFYVALQAVYLKNARELHHLEASTAARAVSLAAQTFAGASAVRAGRLQPRLRDRFQRQLDDSHNTLLALNSANRWLGLTMDLVGAGCVFVSLATALWCGSGAGAGLTGAYSLLLPVYLSHLAKCRADLDLQLSAVERVVADTAVPQEDYKDDCPIPSGWQRNGRIVFEDVSVHHEPSTSSILKNINLKIESGEKMAICGRSGSGKSTLLLTCVGATTIQSGRVLIDGQDITRVPLRVLRHRVVVMPQENIIFSGTLRENLDPLGVHTDEEIWQSLKAVGLFDFVHAQPAGLECYVCGWRGGGCAGRRARVCGARAALHARSAAVLLLDEPAAPLDAHAERSLLHALAEIAPNTTVITVTHRVSSIRGYDTAAVLDEGRLIERGSVSELLAAPTSRLTRMLAAVHGPTGG